MQLEWLFHLSHLMHIMNFDKNFDARTSQDNAVYAIKALMMWHCESKQSMHLNMLIMGYTNSEIRGFSSPIPGQRHTEDRTRKASDFTVRVTHDEHIELHRLLALAMPHHQGLYGIAIPHYESYYDWPA